MFVQKAEQLSPRRVVRVDRLETDQKRRDVVAGLRVQRDLLNEDGPQRTAAIPARQILRSFASGIQKFSHNIQIIDQFSFGHEIELIYPPPC